MEVGGWLVIRWGVGRRLPLNCHPQAPGQPTNSLHSELENKLKIATASKGSSQKRTLFSVFFIFCESKISKPSWLCYARVQNCMP